MKRQRENCGVWPVAGAHNEADPPERVCRGSGLFGHVPLRAADGLHFLHTFLHGRLGEVRTAFELLQHAGTLILLFEAFDGAINGLILRNDDAYQTLSPPSRVLNRMSALLSSVETGRQTFQQPPLPELFK